MKGRGRPKKLNPYIQALILEAIRSGMTRELTAKYAGIHVSTLYHWLALGQQGKKEYKDFYEAVNLAEAKGAMYNLSLIRKAAQKHWQAAAWLLERRHAGFGKHEEEPEPITPAARASTVALLEEIKELDTKLAGVLSPVISQDDL